MKYVPMTDNEWNRFFKKAPQHDCGMLDYEQAIEQFVLARIEAQGLGIVPKADAERVALLERIDNHMEDNSDLFDLLRDIRAYLGGDA